MPTIRSLSRALAVSLAAGAVVILPLSPSAAATDPEACAVTGGTLIWGFKESFRSYISGTIAKGAWETTGGAGYETPTFSWTAAGGSLSPSGSSGEIAFAGSIRFTGHGGLLDTTVSDPVVSIADASTGRLSLDLTGVTMEQAMSGADAEPTTVAAVPLVELDLTSAAVARDGDILTYTASGAPTVITAEGFEAFGNYPAGTAFDPVSLTVTAACPAEETAATPLPSLDADAAPASEQTPPADARPWVIGGAIALGVVAAVTTVAAVAVRRRRGGAS